MKIRNSIMLGVTALSLGGIMSITFPTTIDASSWHTSAIPYRLRGHWYATANPNYGVKIYRHYIHFSGEKSVHVTKWKYLGNHFYKFRYSNAYGDSNSLHYFSPHKISMNSFWHSYFR
ncbi:hypothetical protein [Lentilactobacillus diolivorans]|jgi:hypothetical protein|uniref:Uncharacterized protein n=2 Tax=Lentilactobacillus TaxID=2767893 RepID=A0ABQ0XH06_9LACO|nr:hypothetical protein [Lentilactobacillus diolivorans]RRG06774.1 MAG: hypothetical protein DUD35_14270 [Lactobacillus sp.]GEP25337.1 hypothetical protein LDI01_29300 [Lentilactobacillus diolivorans]